MPFCPKCGNKLDDGVAFCSKCGTATEWLGNANKPEEYEKREQAFVGKIKKCPQCGAVLSSDAVVCPECGHELGVDTISQELKDFKIGVAKMEAHAASNEKIAALLKSSISNFSVPHKKGDLRDLLVFVSGRVKNETTESEWFLVWYSKLRQIVDEVKILFGNDKEFIQPFLQLQEECDKIAETRRNKDAKVLRNKGLAKKWNSIGKGKKTTLFVIAIITFLCILGKLIGDPEKQSKTSQYSAPTSTTTQKSTTSKSNNKIDYSKTDYREVKIGKQVWMAENLAIKTTESGCYDNDVENCKKYGRLYTWKDARSACPTGWTLPTIEDIQALTSYMIKKGAKPENIGTDLKSSTGWNKNKGTPSGTDKFKFKAIPGGKCLYRSDYTGEFNSCDALGDVAFFWTATKTSDHFATAVRIDYDKTAFNGANEHQSELLSVRCLKE